MSSHTMILPHHIFPIYGLILPLPHSMSVWDHCSNIDLLTCRYCNVDFFFAGPSTLRYIPYMQQVPGTMEPHFAIMLCCFACYVVEALTQYIWATHEAWCKLSWLYIPVVLVFVGQVPIIFEYSVSLMLSGNNSYVGPADHLLITQMSRVKFHHPRAPPLKFTGGTDPIFPFGSIATHQIGSKSYTSY